MQRKYGDKLTVTSVHPGLIASELPRFIPEFLQPLYRLMSYSTHEGALNQLYAGLAPETEGAGGKYFIPFARDGSQGVDKRAFDEKVQDDLAAWVHQETKNV